MRALAWLRSLINDQKGNALVICAATLPLLIGSAAIGVDTIQASVARRQLQRAADSAALAGAFAKLQSKDPAIAATHDLTFNNDVALSTAPVIENAPSSGNFRTDTNAVRVILTAQRSVPFIAFFTGSPMTVRAEATATRVSATPYCVLALENGSTTGVTFTGTATIALGCGVATNSQSSNAIVAQGNSIVSATPLTAVGVVPPSANYTPGTELNSYSSPLSDPYARLPNPTVPANCQTTRYTVEPNGLPPPLIPSSPGVYCYRGMALKGTVILPSGTYIIDGDLLDITSQANVTCLGCTFVLTSRLGASKIAQLSLNGQAITNLTAPSSGTYAGVVMYQDRQAQYGTTYFRGGATTTILGGLYFPKRLLTFEGNGVTNTQCLQLVALRLSFAGNASISNDCPLDSGASAFGGTYVRLVA